MRFYCTIKTNFGELCKEFGLDKDDIIISVDSLKFARAGDETFDIDFEYGDYDLTDTELDIRLKALGTTFSNTWNHLEIDLTGTSDVKLKALGSTLNDTWDPLEKDLKSMENDNELFATSELTTVVLHITENEKINDEFVSKLNFEYEFGAIEMGGWYRIEYYDDGTKVELYSGDDVLII